MAAMTSNILLAWDAVGEECTLSGGLWTTTLPLANSQTRQIDEKARSVNADSRNTRIYVTAQAAITVAAASLYGSNFSTAGKWRLRSYATDPVPSYEASFAYSTLPAGLSFSRSSAGRAFDVLGYSVSSGNNVHRINYDRSTHRARGVLLEGGSTNWLLNNRTSTGWTVVNGTPGTATGLDGVAASCVLLTATSANCEFKRAPSAAGAVPGQYVLSFWVYGIVVTGNVALSLDNFTSATNVTIAVGQWTRVVLTGAYNAGNVGIRLAASGDSVRIDFAQFESGTNAAPTSEIVNTGSVTSRSADALNIADLAALGVTKSSMTMALRLRVTRLPDSGGAFIAGIYTGALNEIGLRIDGSNVARISVVNTGVTQASIAGPTVAVGDYLTVAVTWSANNIRVSFNGGAVAADTSATLPNITPFQVANDNGVGIELERLMFFNGQRSDADLVALAGGGEDMSPVAADDSTLQDAWPAAYLSATTARRRRKAKTPAFFRPAVPYSQQWFRLDIVDEANADGYVEFGYLGLLWSVFQAETNAQVGVGVGFKSRSSSVETDSGAEYDEIRPNPREFAFQFPALTDAEAWGEVFEMMQIEGDTGMVLFSLDPTDTANLPRQTFFAKLAQLPKLSAIARGLWGAAFLARERL